MLSTTGFEYRRRKKIVDEQNISTLYTINIYNRTIHEIDDKVRESSLMKKKPLGKVLSLGVCVSVNFFHQSCAFLCLAYW